LRNAVLTFRLRATATTAPATMYIFDHISLVVDRCD
jgi:hypothetical protein